MKRTWANHVARATVIAAIAGGVLACRKPVAREETDVLRAGTTVPAMLAEELESGVSKEGSPVSLIVLEDVRGASGRIALKAGTPLKGIVAWSRREDALGALTQTPARLHIRLVETTTVDGGTVPLASDDTLKPDGDFELNRANTGKVDLMPKLEPLLRDPKSKDAAEALTELLKDGRLAESANTPEGVEKLGSLCDSVGLANTAALLRQRQAPQAEQIVRQIQSGTALTAVATGGTSLGLAAAAELANAVGEVGGRLERAMRGRNIRAYAGTPVTAYVAKDVNVRN